MEIFRRTWENPHPIPSWPWVLLVCSYYVRPEDENKTIMNWDYKNQQEFTLKSPQKERIRAWVQQAFALGPACWGRAPLWAYRFVEGQRMIAYEFTDITGLIKSKGHWHTRASPLWRSASCLLKELSVWVDSSLHDLATCGGCQANQEACMCTLRANAHQQSKGLRVK